MVRKTHVREHARTNAPRVREHERVIRNDPREDLARPSAPLVDKASLMDSLFEAEYGVDNLPANVQMPDRGDGPATAMAFESIPSGAGSNMAGVVLADWGNEYVVWRVGKDGSVYWGHYFPKYREPEVVALAKARDDFMNVVDSERLSYGKTMGPVRDA